MNKPIDYGRRSEIFDEGNHTVLKLYDKEFPRNKIEREFDNTLSVYNLQRLLVPKPLKLIEKNNRLGIIFEKIEGISLMTLFQQNPIRYFTYGKIIANLHRRIHEIFLLNIPSQVESFTDSIEKSELLNKKEKILLHRLLQDNAMTRLCHGDFHHGNIIMTPKGDFYIIDWMDAFYGDPLLDVALTAVNASVSDAPPHISYLYRKAYDLLKKLLALDKRYLHLYGVSNEKSMSRLLLLAAGIHLSHMQKDKSENHRIYFYTIKSTLQI